MPANRSMNVNWLIFAGLYDPSLEIRIPFEGYDEIAL
jgi:hypothetical protein